MLHCISGGGKDKTLGGKGWGASGASVVLQFFTSILPMALWAAGTSLISATATRNQLYLPYSNTLNVFSSPFPEFGTGSHGQNKLWFVAIISLNFFLQSNTDQCWATANVLLLGKLFMYPKGDAHISMTLLFAPVLMATHTKAAPTPQNCPCFKSIICPIKTHTAKPAPLSLFMETTPGRF